MKLFSRIDRVYTEDNFQKAVELQKTNGEHDGAFRSIISGDEVVSSVNYLSQECYGSLADEREKH